MKKALLVIIAIVGLMAFRNRMPSTSIENSNMNSHHMKIKGMNVSPSAIVYNETQLGPSGLIVRIGPDQISPSTGSFAPDAHSATEVDLASTGKKTFNFRNANGSVTRCKIIDNNGVEHYPAAPSYYAITFDFYWDGNSTYTFEIVEY